MTRAWVRAKTLAAAIVVSAGAVQASIPCNAAGTKGPPIIAAASDLQFVLPAIAQSFTSQTGQAVRLTFGSSGNFARQIRSGAPFEMFLSADEQLVDALAADGFTIGAGQLYAQGQLALIVPKDSPLKADGTLGDLANALQDGRLTKLAIANPEHAPYGARAKEALAAKGLWDRLTGKLVLGENVSQAAQFALSGGAEAGLIAQSLALNPAIAARSRSALVSGDLHQPLHQRMVLTKHAGAVARAFFDYMRTSTAREALKAAGFSLPH